MGIYKFNASGEVSIFRLTTNKKELIETRSNSILPLMKDVVARLLGNFAIGRVDTVKVYRATLLLASVPIVEYIHPELNKAQYNVVFDEGSFSGSFDELGLFSSNMGQVSKLSGLSGSKLSTEKLLITWTISIL